MKVLVIIAFMLLISCEVFASDVIIIGGWGTTEKQMELLNKNIENSTLIIPQTHIPLGKSAEEIFEKLENKGMTKGKFVLIGYSWGGLVARQFTEDHPEMVKKIICIGTPNNGYPLTPNLFFNINNAVGKNIPTFAIAGSSSKKRWFFKNLNDGVVEIDSALNLPRLDDFKIFPLSHLELINSREVIKQIFEWTKD
ncbi:MAG: alpha/beta fold hydrolase [Patescibacteria group bacterium]|nr:alpha/beta fold hydrolase [Patescibacteria group bacterium]